MGTAVNRGPEPAGRIQSIDRAAALLAAIAAAPEPQTAPALAHRCALNRSTAWRILATLEHHRLVERDPAGNRYSVGLGVLRLAAGAGHEPLARYAHPLLRRLAEATGETVNVAIVRRHELVYADQVRAPHVMAPDWLGHAVPLHATSTGKAFLAVLPPDEAHALLRPPLERFTGATVTEPGLLLAELDDVRRRGYAISRGELEPALWGASAVAHDAGRRPAAVVSAWGADARVRDRLDRLGTQVAGTARELSALLAA